MERADWTGSTPLFAAVMGNHLECVELLTGDGGSNLHATRKDGWTPLFAASRQGYLDIVRELIDAGAEVDRGIRIDGETTTPFFVACQEGHLDVAGCLHDRGADVDLRTMAGGDTALSMACHAGEFHVAQFVLERGGQFDAPGYQDLTPAAIAEKEGHQHIVVLLKAAKMQAENAGKSLDEIMEMQRQLEAEALAAGDDAADEDDEDDEDDY